MVRKNVVWDDLARNSLREAYQFIKEDSVLQADKFMHDIILATGKLAEHPEMYPPDKYQRDGNSRFRAFEKNNYRVSYLVTANTIRILRFRHVKQKPEE